MIDTTTADTTTPAPVAVRDVVTYHGSLAGHHGRAIVASICDCPSCWDSADLHYELIPVHGSGMLLHVRRESFTVVPA